MKKVLTIAGSDCSGGAGMSVITALTAQNTLGVTDIMEVNEEFVREQLKAIYDDIRPDSVKIGMVSNSGIIKAIGDKLRYEEQKNIVIDPVMVSTSGSRLISQEAVDTLIKELISIGDVITPNIYEAEILCGFSINNLDDMHMAGKEISKLTKGSVLIKGGHSTWEDEAVDLLYRKEVKRFSAKKIDNLNTHGTGCTLSTAIACNLSMGKDVEQAVADSKAYLTKAINAKLNLGRGRGPLNHMFDI